MSETPQTSEQPTTLQELLRDFYNESIERFPGLKEKLVIIDANERSRYGTVSLQNTPFLSESEFQWFINTDPDTTTKKSSNCIFTHGLALLRFNNPIAADEIGNLSEDVIKKAYFTLDHEIGHLALPNGMGRDDGDLNDDITSECVADAYALIRHYQRFGANDPYKDKIQNSTHRTWGMVRADEDMRDGEDHGGRHYTAPVLDEIEKRKNMIDFQSLSPQQTADLALRFAMEYKPAAPVVNNLRAAFKTVRDVAISQDSVDANIRALAKIALSPKTGYYTFKASDKVMTAYLKKPERTTIPKDELADIKNKLLLREIQLEKQGILFGIPTKPANVSPGQLKLF